MSKKVYEIEARVRFYVYAETEDDAAQAADSWVAEAVRDHDVDYDVDEVGKPRRGMHVFGAP